MKRKLLKGTPPGNLIKWEAVYDTPWWRATGYSGQAVSEQGPANTTFDNTPPGGSPGILFGFVGGKQARSLPQANAGRPAQGGARQLRHLLRRRGAQPEDAFELDWTQEAWTRGCRSGTRCATSCTATGPR